MTYNHAIRITLPYEDCSGIISRWADRCHAVVAYQHTADDEVSKTHVHLAVYGCEVKTEALKRMWPDAPGKGNEFWSWKPLDGEYLSQLQDATKVKFITYMSKGTLWPVFVKNISQATLENSRQDWVEPVKADNPEEASEYLIRRVCERVNEKRIEDSNRRYERGRQELSFSANVLLQQCRDYAFSMMYARGRRMPHSTQYKIIAGSAFLRLCEQYECFEEGAKIISDLWL